MFKYLISALALACVVCVCFLYMESIKPVERTVPAEVDGAVSDFASDLLEVESSVEPSEKTHAASAEEAISLEEIQELIALSTPKEDEKLIDETDCLVFYPFTDGRLPALHRSLPSSLLGRMQIHEFDRLRYHIEAASSSNGKVWAKRREEIRKAFPGSIESGDRSVLRIASIGNRRDARTIADYLSKTYLDVKISIREENSAKGKVALVFGRLSADENRSLRKLLLSAGTDRKVDACSSFEQ